MIIPYRTQRVLKRILAVLLALAVVAVAACACWFVWAQRYIIYTADGQAQLNFDLPPLSQGQPAEEPEDVDVTIRFDTEETIVGPSTELVQMTGYYVEPDALKNLATVKAQIQALPAGTPVMMDVKNIYGGFYYSTGVSTARSENVDTKEVDALIKQLNQSGAYVIARFPALRDKAYGLEHDEDGVFHSSRGYLWVDEEGCYWLNPSREGTLSYITRIVTELKGLGFDEVVLADFQVPRADNTYFEGDRDEAIASAAKTLLSSCGSEYFAVSFTGSAGFPLPEGRARLYVETASAAEVESLAQQSGLADPMTQLVFLTENHDTRFNDYSVMRPISAAH